MATETAEPRTGLIATIAVLVIASILGIRFFLVSYFNQMYDAENFSKSAGVSPGQLVRQRALEREHLENGAVPITQAMQLIAQGGRPAAIAPQPSTDYSALQGWSQRPTGWHPPPPITIVPGPTMDPNAPTMQGGPSSENAVPGAPSVAPTAPAPTAAPAAGGAEAH